MIERNSDTNNGLSKGASAEVRLHQTATEQPSERHLVVVPSEQHTEEQVPAAGPPKSEGNGVDWQTIVFWAFVVFSFVAFVFALYAVWAKCHYDSPF
jgi:hypothetical protein